MPTETFDTGMLIALERRKRPAWEAFRAIIRRGLLPVVPAVVYVEWWRGRSDAREEILEAMLVEDMPPALCRAAGEALASVRGASLADAVVMASAALRGGGVVYTSDVDDLCRLQRHFSTVLVLPAKGAGGARDGGPKQRVLVEQGMARAVERRGGLTRTGDSRSAALRARA